MPLRGSLRYSQRSGHLQTRFAQTVQVSSSERCSVAQHGLMAGGYLSARPLRELRPRGLFASLTLRGLGCLISHTSLLARARHAVPLQPSKTAAVPKLRHSARSRGIHVCLHSNLDAATTRSMTACAGQRCPHHPHHSPSFLTPHALPPHPSPLTPHPSLLTPPSSLLPPHPSLLTPPSSHLPPHPSLLTPPSSPLIPHSSPLTPHPSPLTPPSSPLTPHSSPLTPHPSLLTPPTSLLQPHPFLAFCCSRVSVGAPCLSHSV